MAELKLSEKHLKDLRKILVAHVPNEEVWAYGSRVNGTAHDTSDLDLVVRHPQDLGESQGFRIDDLKEALSNSNLPLIVDVHDWADLPENFHKNIEKSYLVLQASNAKHT